MEVSQKTKNTTTTWPSNSIPGSSQSESKGTHFKMRVSWVKSCNSCWGDLKGCHSVPRTKTVPLHIALETIIKSNRVRLDRKVQQIYLCSQRTVCPGSKDWSPSQPGFFLYPQVVDLMGTNFSHPRPTNISCSCPLHECKV